MNCDRWNRVKRIAARAAELEPSQRASYVRKQCEHDHSLIDEVADQLDGLGASTEFLASEPSPLPDAEASTPQKERSSPGHRKRLRTLRVLSYLIIACSLLWFFGAGHVFAGVDWSLGLWGQAAKSAQGVGTLLFAIWLGYANWTCRELGAAGLRHSPWGVFTWLCIPVANLFMAPEMAAEVWRASGGVGHNRYWRVSVGPKTALVSSAGFGLTIPFMLLALISRGSNSQMFHVACMMAAAGVGIVALMLFMHGTLDRLATAHAATRDDVSDRTTEQRLMAWQRSGEWRGIVDLWIAVAPTLDEASPTTSASPVAIGPHARVAESILAWCHADETGGRDEDLRRVLEIVREVDPHSASQVLLSLYRRDASFRDFTERVVPYVAHQRLQRLPSVEGGTGLATDQTTVSLTGDSSTGGFWNDVTTAFNDDGETHSMSLFVEQRIELDGAGSVALPPGYRCVGILGRGGFGVVLDAVHEPSGRRVAFKVLQRLGSSEDLIRFRREAEVAGMISHPRLVFVYDFFEMGDCLGIASELVTGGTLQDRVDHEEPISIVDVTRYTVQLLEGLEELHSRGLLHLDLKPANCFLTDDDNVKVGDFGLVGGTSHDLGIDEDTARGGTPAYAAPEQLEGASLDQRADLFAVGATMFALLTGGYLDEGSRGRPAVALREQRPDAPKPLVRLVAQCLQSSRDERPADATVLREALQKALCTEEGPADARSRIWAGVLDGAFLGGALAAPLAIIFGIIAFGLFPSIGWQVLLWGCALAVPFYFSIVESGYRSGIGKRAAGLRVVGNHGPAAFWRVFLRSTILVYGSLWLTTVLWEFMPNGLPLLAPLLVVGLIWLPCHFRVFGYRGLHEILSGTRTIAGWVTPPIPPHEPPRLATIESLPETVGTSRIVALIGHTPNGVLYEGLDPQFARKTWLLVSEVRVDEEPEPVETAIPAARPPRLLRQASWQGRKVHYLEDIGGQSFSSFLEEPNDVRWHHVREWILTLCDLSSIDAPWSAQQLWIDRDWTLRLLPFSVTTREGDEYDSAVSVATIALELRRVCVQHADDVPEDGFRLLDTLCRPDLSQREVGQVAELGRTISAQPRPLSRQRRVVHFLFVSSLLPIYFWGPGAAFGAGILAGLPPERAVIVVVLTLLLTSILFRGGVTYRLFGIHIRRLSNGQPADWLDLFRRGLLIAVIVPTAVALYEVFRDEQSGGRLVVLFGLFVTWFAFFLTTLATPTQSLIDRWLGWKLVR